MAACTLPNVDSSWIFTLCILIVSVSSAECKIRQNVEEQQKHIAGQRRWSAFTKRLENGEPVQKVWLRKEVGEGNLARYSVRSPAAELAGMFSPGDPAKPFTVPTLDGVLTFPDPSRNLTWPVLLHAYNKHSAFAQCLWNCSGSLEALVQHSPTNTHYVFMSQGEEAPMDALWMQRRFTQVTRHLHQDGRISMRGLKSMLDRVHFITRPTYELGNWIPAVFKEWTCMDHNCGLDQAVFTGQGTGSMVLPRLDARYDWLPMFKLNKTFPFVNAHSGCAIFPDVKGKVALVTDMECSYFKKIQNMEKSGAIGVVIVQVETQSPQDMNCNSTSQCGTALNIPATMVTNSRQLLLLSEGKVIFQNTPANNFFFGIDGDGLLAETGWFLYPSFYFLAWQAQWFNYRQKLNQRLAEKPSLLVPVFNNTVMQGSGGAVAKVKVPAHPWGQYEKMELDMALSCPGSRDTTCAHWDHTVQLFVCCNVTSPLCGAELGRWISPFRRRIGRWLTDVTSLMPLLDDVECTFTMKTVPWAMPWKPSLNLRFSGKAQKGKPVPSKAYPLYQPGFTFDNKYNSHFTPMKFTVSSSVKKIEIVAIITGHGSDENGCGEFCVTSHHFVVNSAAPMVKTFTNAGTPLGCAERVPYGVEPNEHGTWLYGRDGWCDGQEVDPWVIDISGAVSRAGAVNTLRYYGWFNGTDPDPKQSPGTMIFYSYLVAYNQNPLDQSGIKRVL